MLPFVRDLALAYIAFTFLVTGTFHALHFARLCQLLSAHRIVPPGRTVLAAAALISFEFAVGALSLASIVGEQRSVNVAGLSGLAGLAFVLYLRRLLQTGAPRISCGCSPMAGLTTGASLVPPAALLIIGATVLLLEALAGGTSPGPWDPGPPGRVLSAGWGVLLAWAVMLVPAVVPQPESREDHGLADH